MLDLAVELEIDEHRKDVFRGDVHLIRVAGFPVGDLTFWDAFILAATIESDFEIFRRRCAIADKTQCPTVLNTPAIDIVLAMTPEERSELRKRTAS